MMSIRKYLVVALLAMFAGAAVAGTTPEGLEYLNANKLKEGVTELPSGLQYRVLKEGPAGGPSPGVSTRCACHYRGTTIDGKEFDSSYSRGQPTTFAPNQVIKGWTEAMQPRRRATSGNSSSRPSSPTETARWAPTSPRAPSSCSPSR